MNFKESVRYLDNLFSFQKSGFKKDKNRKLFTLKNVNCVLKKLQNPENRLRVIHIAGSKGKGTIANLISILLLKNGFKTGLFISPCFFDLREMIQINQKNISAKDFARLITKIKNICEDSVTLTQFETLTIIAFLYFYENKVDYAVFETGLGGKYDATNVCKKPILTILTLIEKEHTDYFGNKFSDIVKEKCGILRHDVPLIYYKSSPSVIKKIQNEALKYNANIIDTAKTNEEVALKALLYLAPNAETKNAIKTINQTKIPGRFEVQNIKNITFIFDVAHTPSSASYFRTKLDKNFPNKKIIFILAFLKDKNSKKFIKNLLKKDDEMLLTAIDHPRALIPSSFEKPDFALKEAILKATKKDRIICITGSFGIVSAIKKISRKHF